MIASVEAQREKFKREEIEGVLKDFFDTTRKTIKEEVKEGALKDTTLEAIVIDFEDVLKKIPADHLEEFRSEIEQGIGGLYVEGVKEALKDIFKAKQLDGKPSPVSMNGDPKAPETKTSYQEKREVFLTTRLPELLNKKVGRGETRKHLNNIIQEAVDNYVLTRGRVRDAGERDTFLKEFSEELKGLGIEEKDLEGSLIELQWSAKDGRKKHRIFLRNDIAVAIEENLKDKNIPFTNEEIERMRQFVLTIRSLQNEISKIMANPENTIDLSQQAGETEEQRASRIAREDAEKDKVKSPETVQAVREAEDILNTEEKNFDNRIMEEATNRAIGFLEKKAGRSLEFSPDQYPLIKKHIDERFAEIMASRAEDYLSRHRSEIEKRGMDSNAKGAAAVNYVKELGVIKKIIEGDRELEKLHTVLTALSEFSRSDIPPSARFAILEQLNQLPDSEEVKKLRVEVFQKWSGREPEIQQPTFDIAVEQRLDAISNAKLQELVANLSAEELLYKKPFALNVDEEKIAKMKYIGCRFRRTPPIWYERIFNYDGPLYIIRNGAEINLQTTRGKNEYLDLLDNLDTSWKDKLKQEEGPRIREKVKLDYDSAFVSDVTNISQGEIEKRYKSLRDDIDTQYTRRLIDANKKGEKVTEETDEALAETGKSSMQLVRSMIAGEGAFGSLSGDVEKDRDVLLRELKDNWDLDIPPEQFDRFVKESGMDYNLFSKKRRGLVYFMLNLASHVFQEAKKITI